MNKVRVLDFNKERALTWRPFTQMKTVTKDLSLEVVSAKKALLQVRKGRLGSDSFKLSSIIDAISSWWVITHGHCEEKIVEAIQRQAQVLDQALFADFSNEKSRQLVDEVLSILPTHLRHVFFSDNGSTSVEVALKMVLQSWRQRGEGGRKFFLSFTHSYHGDTVGAMSVSGRGVFTEPYEEMLFPVIRAQQGIRSTDKVGVFVLDFKKKIKEHHRELGAVILEPFVQGAGGMVVWPKEAVEEVCFLTKKFGLYLIFDEVMTGFGRTGDLFAFEKLKNQELLPDILCLSKGLTGGVLPLALTITTSEVFDSFLSQKKEKMFFHGHSFTGNAIASAAALANLKLIKERNLKKDWQRIESFHTRRIRNLKQPLIKDVRTCGTIAALEFEDEVSSYTSSFAQKFKDFAIERGVFLRPLGNIVYILPPYSITDEELAKTWDVIENFN